MLPSNLPVSACTVSEEAKQAAARELMAGAYQALRCGDPVGALQRLLRAVQVLGGPGGAGPVLRQFQDDLVRLHPGVARVDEIGQLAQLLSAVQLQQDSSTAMPMDQSCGLQYDLSISAPQEPPQQQQWQGMVPLEQHGSYLCQRCGGIVSIQRREAHEMHWCQPLS